MDNTDFINSYIVKLAGEYGEKCKETVVLMAKLEYAEKANGGLADANKEMATQLEATRTDLANSQATADGALLRAESLRVAHDQAQTELRNTKFRLESENSRLASRLANIESVLAAKQAELDALKAPKSKKKKDKFESASVS